MISREKLLYLTLICFFILVLGKTTSAKTLNGMEPGDPVPDFQVRLTDGKQFTLGAQRGKILILNFWERGQKYSDSALADLERIFQEYRDKGVTVLALDVDKASESELKSYGSARNLTISLALDADTRIYGLYGIIVLPSTLIIGVDGKLAYYRAIHTGDFYNQIRGNVRLLLGEINQAQLEMMLNPKKITVSSGAREKANLHLQTARMLLMAESDIMKDKARSELEKAVKADPEFLDPRLLLAKSHLDAKEFEKARNELELALKLDPSSIEAKSLMEQLRGMD